MSDKGIKTKRAILALVLTIGLFLVSYYIGNYGLPISLAMSFLLLPYLVAASFPEQRVLDFYGRHLKWITIIIFVALPTVWTVVLYGIIGILLLFEIPIIFLEAPPLLALIITDAGILLCHRILTYKVLKKEKHPESVMRTIRTTDRLIVCILLSLMGLFLLVYALGKLDLPGAVGYLLWPFTFVFWSYFFMYPISLFIANSHKRVRLCLMTVIEVFEEKDLTVDKRPKDNLSRLMWLRVGLKAYDALLSSQPDHPSLISIDSYYDAAYSALLTGTANDRKRILTALKSMLKALGKNKKENNFKAFLCSLARIKRTGRITWENRSVLVRPESRIQRIGRQCKPIVVYLVPLLGVVVQVVIELWRSGWHF